MRAMDGLKPEVESNLIRVPFRAIEDVYFCHKAGSKVSSLAAACNTTEQVIQIVLNFQKRKILRERFQGPKRLR